ncbi:uncharacterized protein LOC123515474 isoform X2 [Portunus trituberculatus]|uniref:uncharacterized protein LOC123515474 isoform X2 n=1 Tax=Portunus trituberculatus TaxID=210409 RepID=UPI001E1D0A7C|nr:uncharacterized protein LOC123515474 isoform X2 [Portunus trituberculatus]
MQPKKNPSTTAKNKINQLLKSKGNKKVLSESNKNGNINHSQDEKVSKKKKIPKNKSKKENVSAAVKGTKKSQCQPLKASKKKIFSTKKKTFLSDSGTKASSVTEMPSKTKTKVTKSSSSSSSKHKTMKHGLYIQKEENIYESDTDDSTSDVVVSKDNSESISQSPVSHDSPKRSPDLTLSPQPSPSPIAAQENAPNREITHNKAITRKNTEKVTDSLDGSRYNRETSRDGAEETTNLSETVKERVMQLLNSMDEDLWVQCNGCYKWRKLIQITDPATLPDKWYCTMMPFPGRNTCEEPEEEWQETDGQYIYYDRQFVVGSVVWAQVPGSPWWPAMVDIDPDYKRYDWFNLTWTHPTSYHVTFFGDPVTRAWVTCRNIKIFKQSDTYRKFLDDRKKDPIRDLVLRKAVQEACHAISMEIQRRRKTYTFVARFPNRIGKSPDNSHSETHNEKRSSIKSTLTQWKQQKQAKPLHSTASTITGQPNSPKVRDTSIVSDYNKNVQSESSHNIINAKNTDIKEKDCRRARKKQISDDKPNKCNSSGKKVRKIKGVNSTSKEITFKMKCCNLGDHSADQQDSDSSDNTSDRAQNDDEYYITKTSNRNDVESSPGNEKTLESDENIGNKCAISQKHFIINEAKGTKGNGSEKRSKISYNEKEKPESGPTLKSKTSHMMSHGEYGSSDENEEQFDSPTSDCVGRNLKEDDSLEGKSDNMSYDEDTGDDQNDTDEKEHNQNSPDTACVDKKYNNESSPEEYDNEIRHEQLQKEGSCKTQACNNNYTANNEEQDHSDYDQDDNEDKCEEFEDMEYDYEKDNNNENLEIGKKCISQKNYDDEEGDEQYNEEIYEEQDNEDDCESQKDYNNDSDYERNHEETYEGNGDDDDEYEDDYDEQDNTGYEDNKGNTEKQKLFKEQDNKACEDSEDENYYLGHYNQCSDEGESD